ncbi:hypothetical protein HNQ51_002860 [Inhella inkyongensis]|uniref:Mitomycin resistance protein n=1 Tax=Inhella inkyongensis TaxID=392593 RepID=A0A840SAM1_9BURK|nr:helix-hairpin-helix domain-containing protein [Inhella inkyongensis]MBB5205541.1 hypothetical protein [Inhella inkyongensis]
MSKASCAEACQRFEQLPNIGRAMAADFALLGLQHPAELAQQDPLHLYQRLCLLTAQRQDPCVLDTFMAAVDFMRGAPALPWWHYTAARKQQFPDL